MRTSTLIVALWLCARGAVAATPTLVQFQSSSAEQTRTTTIAVSFPNAVGASNAILVGLSINAASTFSTPTDDGQNSYTLVKSQVDAGQYSAVYLATGVTAGTRRITAVVNGTGVASGIMHVEEWRNIALSGAVDAVGSISNTNPTVPVTTSVAGDLIWQWGVVTDAATPNLTNVSAGTNFTLLTANRQSGQMAQFWVQPAAGAVSSTFSASPAHRWESVTVALKSAAAGTPPAGGIRINSIQHWVNHATPIVSQVPCTGNLLALVSYGVEPLTGVSDSNGNSWSSAVTFLNNRAREIWYAPHATCTSTMTLTVSYAGSAVDMMNILYDISGAAAAPLSVTHSSNGQQKTTGNLTTDTLTPTVVNGLVINATGIAFHSLRQMVGAKYIPDMFSNLFDDDFGGTGGTGCNNTPNSELDEDNGVSHVYNADLTPLTFVYTNSDPGTCSMVGVQYWESVTASFVPAGGAPSTPTGLRIQ